MMQAKRAVVLFRSVLLLAVAAGCSDQLVAPRAADGGLAPAFDARGRSPRDVPEVRIDLPPKARPWDENPAALARAVTDGDGYAVVAFKEPGSARALKTGRRARVTAGTVRAGLQLLERHGAQVVELLDAIGGARVRIDPRAAAEIAGHPLVDFVEPRQYGRVQAQSTPAGIALVQAPGFWASTGFRGAGVKVEIIDTGHQPGHPDLPAVPLANCAGLYGGCDDNASVNWHGTHVLGVIAARDNADGVVGAAPGIAAGDIYLYGACDSAGRCPTDEVTGGISAGVWNVRVMNLSLVQPFDLGQSNAVGVAWSNGIVMVAAAGNNLTSTTVYPAGYANVIGVSGVKPDKSFATTSACGNYSNQGLHVDLAAPFEAYSTVGGGGYDTQCGTSMAAAHVTGVAALLMSQNPTWTPQQVVDTLFARAEDLGTPGRDNQFGHGLVRPTRAQPVSATVSGPSSITAAGTYSWTATPAGGNGTYAYQWEYRAQGATTWTPVGTGQSYSRGVYAGHPAFELRVTVTSAGVGATATKAVSVNILSVYIEGPNYAYAGETTDYQAVASGGTGSYGYEWEASYDGNTWTPVGTSEWLAYEIPIDAPSHYLRVTVTSGGQGTGYEIWITVVQPSLESVAIKGPSVIGAPGTYTWKASPADADETTTYTWEMRPHGDGWSTVGEGSSYSQTFTSPGGPFDLRLTVNSGQTTISATRSVEFEM